MSGGQTDSTTRYINANSSENNRAVFLASHRTGQAKSSEIRGFVPAIVFDLPAVDGQIVQICR
ncbi:MAG: hypothetical protein WCD77_15015, partial [Acidobacteriaceae bacterium]